MATETKLDIISESPKRSPKLVSPLDHEAVEMVFGKPTSPKVEPEVHVKSEKDKHPHVTHKDKDSEPSQPLLEPHREKQQPPLAGPEVDDLDETPAAPAPYPGIDDGLLEPSDKKPELDADSENSHKEPPDSEHDEDGVHGFSNGLDTRFGVDRPGSPFPPGSIPDVNTYQQKKNLAQGMMDLALLSANANQLRYVLESSTAHPYFYPSLAFISISILLQVAVGVGLIMNSRYDVNDKKEICKADKINNMTVLGVFLVTIVNVFITSFSVATPQVTAVNGV
ncbi:ninjurin-A isoform X2 [Cydia pomonella]|uniref:ninjurin-A isoform X2 n=1 Tax=Cydia pomonella TaxID=82600 RepID=UPI002ADE798E|nr:ninjurin-A isoform X2 [Cydia pomonella]